MQEVDSAMMQEGVETFMAVVVVMAEGTLILNLILEEEVVVGEDIQIEAVMSVTRELTPWTLLVAVETVLALQSEHLPETKQTG